MSLSLFKELSLEEMDHKLWQHAGILFSSIIELLNKGKGSKDGLGNFAKKD
jgi:hypothetical protein